ncbi:MAG: hypothetical protein ACE5GH_06845 [Fidelibacterota bacterium]
MVGGKMIIHKGWKCLSLLVLLCFASSFSEAAELKEDVVKELASDLAEVNRLIRATPGHTITLPADDPFAALGVVGVHFAKDVPETLWVAGKVKDLREGVKTQVAYAKGITPINYIATWAGAFEPRAKVIPTGFNPEGELRTATDLRGNRFSWAKATLVRTASGVVEERIRAAITKLEQMKKKYAGKGLILKGFSLSLLPVPSLSVNFEFE